MIRTKRSPHKRMITDINITPFTDVCLVLLIIFMVSATALTKETSLKLNLPKSSTANTPMPVSVTVKIAQNRDIFLNYDQVSDKIASFDMLAARLQAVQAARGVKLVVIRADQGIPYQLVISTIDAARKVGLTEIALATQEPDAKRP